MGFNGLTAISVNKYVYLTGILSGFVFLSCIHCFWYRLPIHFDANQDYVVTED